MSGPELRLAAIGDSAAIHALMLTMAADIPLTADTLEQEEALYGAVRKVLGFGQSWVALDGERVAGFVLVDSAEVGRHWGENELLNLRYAGGKPLDALIGKVLERRVPITATVRDANRTALADRLERLGFRKTETPAGETRYRHEP